MSVEEERPRDRESLDAAELRRVRARASRMLTTRREQVELGMCLVTGGLVGAGLSTIGMWHSAPPWGAAACVALSCSIGWLWGRRWQRRRAERLEASGYRLCFGCGYDLRGVEGERCPECGVCFNDEDLRAFWVGQFGRAPGAREDGPPDASGGPR